MSLEIEHLTVEREPGFCLRIPGWSLGRGDIGVLTGPAGSGKTLFLETLAGFHRPLSGEIRVGGRSVAGLPVEQRNISVLFEKEALFPHMTVLGNMSFVVGHPRRAKRWLSLAGFQEFSSFFPRQLTAFDRRRVELLRALARRPEVLLIDEPTAGMPEEHVEEWREYVRQWLRQTGVTTVVATSDMREAIRWSDRIAVLWKGRLVQEGTVSELLRRPSSPEVAAVTGGGFVIRGQVVKRSHAWILVRVYPGEGSADLTVWSRWLYREWEDVWVYIPEAALWVWPRGGGEAVASPNRFAGSVTQVRMHPRGVAVEVDAFPLLMTIFVPYRDWEGMSYAQGDPVWLSIDPNALHLMPVRQ
ncbi:MAG: ABC transporter ATP-binding protein [Kyrpidia sp.]|nr:ABC transporter ATP-binding protein [Kyrpidia sp.]